MKIPCVMHRSPNLRRNMLAWFIAPVFAWLAVGTVSAQTQTYTESVLCSFGGVQELRGQANCDGAFPNGIILGSDGDFYGTTEAGGRGNLSNCNAPYYTGVCGTVFKITPSGALTTLYSFCTQGGVNCTDGFVPIGNLVEGSDGNFYGTTSAGGSGTPANCVVSIPNSIYAGGCGTIFKITPSGVFTTLYSFCTQGGASCSDGFDPPAGLVEGSDGNFYGTTSYGGANAEGTVFKVTPSGSFTTLYSFCDQSSGSTAVPTNCADGAIPMTGLLLGSDGNFYGSTEAGGALGVGGGRFGTIFKMTPSGSHTILFTFCTSNCETGDNVITLIEGSDGNLYGGTGDGGTGNSATGNGGGTMFKITAAGVFSVLYDFCTVGNGNCLDGNVPGAVLQGSDGNFYGITFGGGASGGGTAFKLTPSGTLTTLYNFCSQGGAGCTDGTSPAGLVQGSDGNFYGTTFSGGTHGYGIVFKLPVSPAVPVLTEGTLANGATYLAGGLVPGSWALVKGTDLSNITRPWDSQDFAGLGNNLPTNLSGVQVMVNNNPAAVYFISPGQISFQVPSGVSGNASVQVINDGVASNAVMAAASNNSPGIFPVIENGINYPAGVFLDGKFVGDPTFNPAFRNATPGDVIQLYATGLVTTPSGVLPTQESVNGVTVTIGNEVIPADFAGLVAVGEFQINFTIPQDFASQPAGLYPISIQVNGVSSPTTINSSPPEQLVIPIQP